MDIKDVAVLIKEVGFPIFVACYVLIRMERSIKNLTESLRIMSENLVKMLK